LGRTVAHFQRLELLLELLYLSVGNSVHFRTYKFAHDAIIRNDPSRSRAGPGAREASRGDQWCAIHVNGKWR